MKVDIFKFLSDLSQDKKDILTEETQASYSPYMINRFLSMELTTVMYANEMNLRPQLPKRLQYDYYLHAIKKNKRYFRYVKSQKEKNIEIVQEYFGYSQKVAQQVLKIFSQKELSDMQKLLEKGGAK